MQIAYPESLWVIYSRAIPLLIDQVLATYSLFFSVVVDCFRNRHIAVILYAARGSAFIF
jgi:hypothetical protein